MHEIKLIIINNGGSLFYSDTDSLVTDLTLAKLIEIMPEKIGDTLGKLKFEYEIDIGYFISNKTYLLRLKSGQLIKKAKGIKSDSLSLSDYETMYYKSNSVFGTKISAI